MEHMESFLLYFGFLVLFLIAVGEAFWILRVRRQLGDWLEYLKEVKENPGQKLFVKGDGILAKIHFEWNELLERNRRQLLELKRAEEANQQILTNLSHDVRTPLASLTGYLEVLDRKKAEDLDTYIHIAYRKALDLKELVDILFEWFRIHSKEQSYQMEYYDINELTREIVIEFLPLLEQNGITLKMESSEEEWILRIDRVAFKRMVRNLIYNAIQHGKCDLIRIELQKKEKGVLISVFNNGIAIPKEKIEFVFDRFYQCDAARSGNGNGLGLAIVKELVMAMGGEISVESAVGYGSTFYLEFPYSN